ncbi:GNAT family N-acetyltransferase [Virgibacillus halophilus]|uniref:GNAT family N-acetyltransferase n=2 Tax=Tigheibacillus halophilus TaxID=361280 RepID=A0ABU5C9Z9_9BACI|nr:GNAT family N-acetyltransferase [Virgibacillus halophilus]
MTLFLNGKLAYQIENDVIVGNKQLVEAWNDSGFGTSAEFLEFTNALAVYGGEECPINETVGLGMSSPVDEAILNEIEHFYHAHDYPAVIRVCPLAHPSLLALTQSRGYELNSFSYRWVLDLDAWTPQEKETDSSIRIAEADEEMLWVQAIAAGFADTDQVSESQNLDLERAFFRMQNSLPVIALEDGIAAAGGILAINNDMASLFTTSTRLSYRKHGLQTALIDWRLRFAKEQGARLATIETDPGSDSQRNVERAGFQLAYVTAEIIKPASFGSSIFGK